MTAPKAASVDQYGRRVYPIPHPETRELVDLPSWTRLKNLLYSGGLETWKLKKVAAAVAGSTSLQMMAADPESCYKAVKQALAADTAAADIGTMVHKHCEDIDRDRLNEEYVGVAAKPWLDHYRHARDVFGWQLVEAEVTVCNHTVGYAGTADRFFHFDDLPTVGGGTFCVDLKTGKDVYPETALQLRAYAGGEWIFEPYDVANDGPLKTLKDRLEQDIAAGTNIPAGRRKWSAEAIKQARAELEEAAAEIYAKESTFRPMPADIRLDYGIVIHLTAEACRLVPVRLDGADEVIRSLARICAWQGRRDVVAPAIEKGNTNECSLRASPGDTGASDHPDTGTAARNLTPDPFAVRKVGVDRRTTLQRRLDWIKAQPCDAAQYLANWWFTSGIPTFKSGEPLTDEQLVEIEQHMNQVEMLYQIPFEPQPSAYVDADEAVDRLEQAFDSWSEDTDPTMLRDLIASTIDKIASTRPNLLAEIKAQKDAAGLTKRLRHDTWTVGELLKLGKILREVTS